MKNRKYGLVVFDKTQNLGDDIQSYAAIQYLPQIDYYIERECLNEFTSQNGEMVNVIMNGWYMHDITSMPPSPFINPLFISIHFTDHLYNECPEYLSGYFLDYLKKYEPIGCRDEVVRKYLTDNNIKNYWSGCLTLTIKKFPNVENGNYICAVDLGDEELSHLRKLTNKEIRIITHKLDDSVNSKLSYTERMHNVEETLKIYQGASLVVTTRLHCALPSLALETPVIMIHDSNNIDKVNRIGVFLELVNHTSKESFISGKFDDLIKNPKANPTNYLEIREKLELLVSEFIDKGCKDYLENQQNVELYKKYFVEQKKYIVNLLRVSFEKKLNLSKQEYMNWIDNINRENRMVIDKINSEKEQAIDKANEEKEQTISKIGKDNQKMEYELNRQINKYMLRDETANKELEVAINNYLKIVNEKQRQIDELYQQLNSITTSKGYRYLEKFRKIKGRLLRRGK